MTIPTPLAIALLAALAVASGHIIAKGVIGAEIAAQEVRW